MFLRVVRATVSNGLKREYVRVVEAYRDQAGKTQHRTVLNLGRKDLLAAHLDLTKLQRLLHGDDTERFRQTRGHRGDRSVGLGPDAGCSCDVA
jgi:hypothetical protein